MLGNAECKFAAIKGGPLCHIDLMTLPILTYTDVTSIEAFAKAVQQKTAYGAIPEKLVVGGQRISMRSVAPRRPTCNPLGENDLRALYSNTGKEIQLECAGTTLTQTPRTLKHIVCVVGHEALHAIQYLHFSKEQIEEAVALNKKSNESPLAYGEYVSCDVELAAHAIMIALELYQTDPPDFDKAARETTIYSYIASRLAAAQTADEVLWRLVETAKEMHPKLQPPKPISGPS